MMIELDKIYSQNKYENSVYEFDKIIGFEIPDMTSKTQYYKLGK